MKTRSLFPNPENQSQRRNIYVNVKVRPRISWMLFLV